MKKYLIAFTNEELYQLYEKEDQALLDLLDSMTNDSIIKLIKDYTNSDYLKYRYFITTLGSYLNNRILFDIIKEL